jgi:hypothetical protein
LETTRSLQFHKLQSALLDLQALLALPLPYWLNPGILYELRYMVIHLFLPVGHDLCYDDGISAFITL